MTDREEFHKALLQELQENKVDLVVLAGLSGGNSTNDRGSISEPYH